MKVERDVLIGKLSVLGTEINSHSNRSLKTHLTGVYDLLVEWNNCDYVCAAGMFHSVYGTSSYSPITLTLTERPKLANMIGAKAERLVYLYCVADRARLLQMVTTAEQGHLLRTDMASETISTTEFSQLLEILYADRVEQLPHRKSVLDSDLSRLHLSNKGMEFWRLAMPFLSPKAQSHILVTSEDQ